MGQCMGCGAETELYVADSPLCPGCADARGEELRRKAAEDPVVKDPPNEAES
jgi:hypothetical protein